MTKPPWPVALSVAPPPRVTERELARMHRVLRSKAFAGIDEANAFLNSAQLQRELDNTPAPAASLERAQDAAYDAWEALPPERYERARAALALDERCSDAWLILAERETTWIKRRRCFERAVAAAERAAHEEGWFREAADSRSLYGHLPARAFFRAKMALSRFLMDGAYLAEARAIYEELLRRDRDDHMGARYEVIQIYHAESDDAALGRLLDEYQEDDSAFLSYERVWLGIVQGVDGKTLKTLTRRAIRSNPHVPARLLGVAVPPERDDGYVTAGGADEAEAYASTALRWWLAAGPGALDWLLNQVRLPKAGRTSTRTTDSDAGPRRRSSRRSPKELSPCKCQDTTH